MREREPITRISAGQWVPVAVLAAGLFAVVPMLAAMPSPRMPGGGQQQAGQKDCTVPAFAKAIGHEEQWKLHNGCAG